MFYKNEFINYLIREKGLSHSSVKMYGYHLDCLQRFLISQGIQHVKEVKLPVIEEYIKVIKKELNYLGYYHRVSWLILYFKFLEEKGVFLVSPLSNYQRPKYSHHESYPVYTEQEITSILENIKIKNDLCFKGKTVLELAYSSALRPREIYNLKIRDIDFINGTLFIEQSKNKKDRKVPVGKTALIWLERYITEIRKKYLRGNTHDYVFILHTTGKKITYQGLKLSIKRTLAMNNLPSLKLYSLRGTSATVLHRHGMNTHLISKLLGHAELKTTQIYIRVNKSHLKEEITNKHPRNKLSINKEEN